MTTPIRKYGPLFWFFLFAWLILNLLQAFFTELAHDEAYYWVYSQSPALGYFDHAPAIAFLIRAGYSLFQNELGVRLFVVVLQVFAIWLMYNAYGYRSPLLYFSILFSLFSLHIGGFYAAPDAPLGFFIALCIWFNQRYIIKYEWIYALGLGLAIAGVLYSKYQGILFLFFFFIAQIRQIRKVGFLFAWILATLLFLPHLFWLAEHDFTTFRYHLVERQKAEWSYIIPLQFIGGQLLMFGPLIWIVLLVSTFRFRENDRMLRTLQFTGIAILLSLFILSFRTTVEANWTASAILPLLIVSFERIRQKPVLKTITLAITVLSFFICLVLRYQIADPSPRFLELRNEFSGWKDWSVRLDSIAKTEKAEVAFLNSYQLASKYWFYSGKASTSFNNFTYRRNQFDLRHEADLMEGKRVLLIFQENIGDYPFISNQASEKYYYDIIPEFHSYRKIRIHCVDKRIKCKKGAIRDFKLTIENPYPHPVSFGAASNGPLYLEYYLFKGADYYDNKIVSDNLYLEANSSAPLSYSLKIPEQKGHYRLIFSIQVNGKYYAFNGEYIYLEVI